MLYFIACHAPDMKGIKIADGLARVSLNNKAPHLAFANRDLAQYYLDSRHAQKLCYVVSEERLSDTIWYDFEDGIIIFKSIRHVKKALIDPDYVFNLDSMAYEPAMAAI